MAMTVSALLASISETLLASGYSRVSAQVVPSSVRVFEDAFGVVGVAVYETWPLLREEWPNSQAALVNLMSSVLRADDAKAWEGYLVLATPASLESTDRLEANRLRYDMGRVRKFVITAEEVRDPSDTRNALQSILPLPAATVVSSSADVLDTLAAVAGNTERLGVQLTSIIEAFRRGDALLPSISNRDDTA